MKRRMIAPRLFNNDSRLRFGHGLPELVKEGIRTVAEREGKSMSWKTEEILVDYLNRYFNIRRPKYKPRKNSNLGKKNVRKTV